VARAFDNSGVHRLPICAIDVFHVAVPLVGAGFKNAYSSNTLQDSIIVRIRSLQGDVGLGNVDPLPGYSEATIEQSIKALRQTLVPALDGVDAGNIHSVLKTMDFALSGFLEAKAAIEMACIDMLSRRLGIPVHQMLGGAVIGGRVHFNAWIGIVPPDQAASEASQWLLQGFRTAKIKLGGGIHRDRDRIKAVRDAVGPKMQLRGDANAGYSVEDSIALGRVLEPYGLQLLEQPVAAHDLAGLAKVRQSIGIPIMADEAITDHQSLIAAIRADCADVVKFKVMKQGGMLKCRHMMETAAAAGLKVVIGHGFGLSINTMSEIMLAATSDNVLEGLESVGPLKMQGDVVEEPLDLSRGSVALPEVAGLGMRLDEERLDRYLVKQ
jgi:muconate cycloisomerase